MGGTQREPRYRFRIPVEYVCGERLIIESGTLRDVSLGGVFIEKAGTHLQIGDTVRAPLKFFSESTMVWVEGTVVRVEPEGSAVQLNPHTPRNEAMLRSTLPLAAECFGSS